MSCTIIRPKDHTAWLEARTQGIGSSEVGTILGLNPFETPLQLWQRKRGITAPQEENFAMKAGHYLEDAVSRFYADETGAHIIKNSTGDWIAVSNEKPYMRVSPDRLFWSPGTRHSMAARGILECKTTQLTIDADDLPKHWFCQLQYQLHVTGLKHGALAWLTQGRTFGQRAFAYDAEFCAFICERIDEFWQKNIIEGEKPDPINTADVLLLYPTQTDGKTVQADEETAGAWYELKEMKEEMKEIKAKADQLEEQIKLRMQDAEALVDGARTLCTWRSSGETVKFCAEALKQDAPEVYSRYTRRQPGTRRFLIK